MATPTPTPNKAPIPPGITQAQWLAGTNPSNSVATKTAAKSLVPSTIVDWSKLANLYSTNDTSYPAPDAVNQNLPVDPGVGAGPDFTLPNLPTDSQLYNQALQQVQGAYAAQLAALASQANQAKGNAKTGDKQLAEMFNGLTHDIGANTGVLKGIYNQGASDISNTYNSGQKDISNIYNQSQTGLAAMLSKLGIQSAAPDVLGQGAQQEALAKSLLSNNAKAVSGAETLQRTGGLNFNVAQQNIAQQTGVNDRADLVKQLNDTLANIAGQRTGVIGQQASAVASRQYQLQQDALSQRNNLMSLQAQALKDAQQTQLNQADLALKQQQLANGSTNNSSMSPYDKTIAKASQLLGNDQASTSLQLLNNVLAGDPSGFHTEAEFMTKVLAANAANAKSNPNSVMDANKLASLASYYWATYKPQAAQYTRTVVGSNTGP
jgi:hypothetical protein